LPLFWGLRKFRGEGGSIGEKNLLRERALGLKGGKKTEVIGTSHISFHRE